MKLNQLILENINGYSVMLVSPEHLGGEVETVRTFTKSKKDNYVDFDVTYESKSRPDDREADDFSIEVSVRTAIRKRNDGYRVSVVGGQAEVFDAIDGAVEEEIEREIKNMKGTEIDINYTSSEEAAEDFVHVLDSIVDRSYFSVNSEGSRKAPREWEYE